IALTDVYTGTIEFRDAADSKRKMRAWVGAEKRFFPHAAQHDFEAWLLVYWDRIRQLSGSRRKQPRNPESVNHNRPPAVLLREIFRTGASHRPYVKTRDAAKILDGQDLAIAASACPELKAFLNTILTLCDGTPLP